MWQFIVASGGAAVSILKDLMHRSDVTEIINACDSGREGELIFRFVYEQANCKKPFPAFGLAAWKQVQSARAFQISKTGAAMTTSINPRFAEQRPIGSLALTRPAFFSILYHKTLNVGRVQTPTLAMLVNRDYAISSFKKEKYHASGWTLAALPPFPKGRTTKRRRGR